MAEHTTATRPRRALAALLLLLAILPLAGCMRVERSLQLNGDGSGVYTLTISVREPQTNDPASVYAGVVAPLEAFGAHVRATGGSYARAQSNGYASWVYTRPFSSVAAADALLQEDPRQDDPHHYAVLFHDALHVVEETRLDGADFHVTGSISLADPLGTATAWRDASESVSITLPNGVLTQQGGVRQDDTVTYTIHYNQSASIEVVGPAGVTTSPLLSDARWLLAGALLVVAGGLLALGVVLLRRPVRAYARRAWN